MSIQISMSDEAAELLWWLIKNQLEGSQTPYWDDQEYKQMEKVLARVTKATDKRSHLQRVKENK